MTTPCFPGYPAHHFLVGPPSDSRCWGICRWCGLWRQFDYRGAIGFNNSSPSAADRRIRRELALVAKWYDDGLQDE